MKETTSVGKRMIGENRRVHNHCCPKCGDRITDPTKSARKWNGYCGHCHGWMLQNRNNLVVNTSKKVIANE